MDQETYLILSAISFIFTVIITIYCINRAGTLKRNKLGWGLFGFILPIVALIWIQFIKTKNFSARPIINESGNSSTKETSAQDLRNSLENLKKKNMLTDVEFKEKMRVVKVKQLHRLVEMKLEPMIEQLNSLLNSGVISTEEFTEKKNKAINTQTLYYKRFPFLDPDTDFKITVIKKSSLPIVLQRQIEEALPQFKSNHVVLFNNQTKQLERSTIESLLEINNSNSERNYSCIDIFQ